MPHLNLSGAVNIMEQQVKLSDKFKAENDESEHHVSPPTRIDPD